MRYMSSSHHRHTFNCNPVCAREQALEFWSTISEEEADRLEDQDPSAPCMQFMKAAAPHLVPILLEMLLKQEEGQEQVGAILVHLPAPCCAASGPVLHSVLVHALQGSKRRCVQGAAELTGATGAWLCRGGGFTA